MSADFDPGPWLNRPPPLPFAAGNRLPWDEPAFSERMLREHLSQTHDRASRRSTVIDRQVAWLHEVVLGDRPGRILDLGCGPGLHLERLCARGHTGVGVDWGPASVAHARRVATERGLACEYRLGDLTSADWGEGYDAITLWFGEWNTIAPAAVPRVAQRIAAALAPGGKAVIEPQSEALVRTTAESAPSWERETGGLFDDGPHWWIRTAHWHAEARAATERWEVIPDAGDPFEIICSTRADDDDFLERVFADAGLAITQQLETLSGNPEDGLFGLVVEPA